MKDLHIENYKTLLVEIKDNLNKCSHKLKESVLLSILSQLMYRFNEFPVKIHPDVFCKNWQANFKIHVEMQRIYNTQNNLEKNKGEGLMLPNFNAYKSGVIKRV